MPYPALPVLLCDMEALRDRVAADAERWIAAHRGDAQVGKSARNLAHYLALRQHDLRPLQERLAAVGLSSLGRCEPHVRFTLEHVVALLRKALTGTTETTPTLGADYPIFGEGARLLAERTARLFGHRAGGRAVRVMVTLPSEAADRPEMVAEMVANGMDCARINCAHDGPDAWERMERHVRAASEAGGRHCSVLMDLAGRKVRTGPIATVPGVLRIKVARGADGTLVDAALVALATDSNPGDGLLPTLRIPHRVHAGLRPGDRLRFHDLRGRRRTLRVLRIESGMWLTECRRGTRLSGATEALWERPDDAGGQSRIDTIRLRVPEVAAEIRMRAGDPAVLTRAGAPAAPPRKDAGGFDLPTTIPCDPRVLDRLRPGDPLWFDDGKMGAVVNQVDTAGAWLTVTHAPAKGYRLKADKGINAPLTDLGLPALDTADLEALDFVCKHADMVGFSFVESAADMRLLFEELARRGTPGMPVVAKIESARAVSVLPEIILSANGIHPLGIMIARGDLAVELGSTRLAEIQEELLWLCEAAHVPVVWATQVLERMVQKGVRSRPELTDAAMGVRAECVMLNKGAHVVDALKVLDGILTRRADHQQKKVSRLRALGCWRMA